MKGIGEGIAFASVCISAAWLDVTGTDGSIVLWIMVILWAVCSDFGNK